MIRRVAAILVLIVTVFSFSGVYATWQYAEINPTPANIEVSVKFGEFNWVGSGDLPTDSTIGEDHIALIQNIVDHAEHGLNSSNSYLNEEIASRKKNNVLYGSRDTLGSMAVTQSDELEEIFGLDAVNLDFLIYFPNDNEYYIFTTNVSLGERGEINFWGNNSKPGNPTVPIGQRIYPIYRTKVVKQDGKWVAVETQVGSAVSDWYEESRRNEHATQIPSFDPSTFVEGNIN